MKQLVIRLYFGVFLKFVEIFLLLHEEYKARSRIRLHFPIATSVTLYIRRFTLTHLCQVSLCALIILSFFSVTPNYRHIFKPLITKESLCTTQAV